MPAGSAWPELPVESWQATRDTFILWLQVIGKVRIAHAPLLNHWWNAPLYVTSRGLTTSLIPAEAGRSFSIDLDLLDHHLDVSTTAGQTRRMPLAPQTVRDFHAELMGLLDSLDLSTKIWPVPVELADAIPFTEDATHGSYDAAAVTASGESSSRCNASSTSSGPGSSASPVPSTCSGGPSTWRRRGSRAGPHRRTRAAYPTVARTSCARPTPTR